MGGSICRHNDVPELLVGVLGRLDADIAGARINRCESICSCTWWIDTGSLYDNMCAGTSNPDYFDFDRYATLEGFAHCAILNEFNVDKCIYVGHSLSSFLHSHLFLKLIMIAASPS
ncbi:hypothetical protein OROMI_000793 [Orobanche minor]